MTTYALEVRKDDGIRKWFDKKPGLLAQDGKLTLELAAEYFVAGTTLTIRPPKKDTTDGKAVVQDETS